MKIIFLKLLVFLVCFNCIGQGSKKNYAIQTIAFYNVENLFDTIDHPKTKDEYSPILEMKSDKSQAYWNKIDNMAQVISEIGKETTKTTPTLIGLAEIENEFVLKDLINSKHLKNLGYDFIHIDSKDWRGIDVALLYKKTAFEPIDYKPYELFAFNEDGYRIKTRDQLLVSGYLDTDLIHIIINHWPSQRSGTQKTNYLRIKSAELSTNIIDELRVAYKNPKIVLMGDFNDDPDAPSFKEVLFTKSKKEKTNKLNLYNPFEVMFLNGHGTLGFRDNLNLFDQILVSKPLSNKDYSTYQIYKSGIYNPSFLTQKQGKYKGYPFRSWSQNNTFTGGYSDHYPVFVYLIKEL